MSSPESISENVRLARLQADYISAICSVCFSMSANSLIGAAFVKDPKLASEYFNDSIRWQMAGAVASAGRPEMVSEFVTKDQPK